MSRDEEVSTVYKVVGRLLLLFIIVMVILLFAWIMFPLISGHNLGYTTIDSDDLFFETNNLTLVYYFHDFASDRRIGVSIATFGEISEIILPPIPDLSSTFPCIDSIEMDEKTIRLREPYDLDPFFRGGTTRGGYFRPAYEFQGLCANTRGQQFVNLEDPRVIYKRSRELIGISASSQYYFPFDKRILDFDVWLNTYQEIGENKRALGTFAPDVKGYVDYPDWDETVTIQKVFSEEKGHDVTHVNIVLRRPLGYIAMAVILLSGLAVFSLSLIKVEEISSFLEVAIGILLGLWGVQTILIPDNVTWPTIIDPLILTSYGLLAFAVFIRFAIKPLWRSLGRERSPDAIETGDENLPLVHRPDDLPIDIRVELPQDYLPTTEQTPDFTLYQKLSLFLLGIITFLLGLLHIRSRNR